MGSTYRGDIDVAIVRNVVDFDERGFQVVNVVVDGIDDFLDTQLDNDYRGVK